MPVLINIETPTLCGSVLPDEHDLNYDDYDTIEMFAVANSPKFSVEKESEQASEATNNAIKNPIASEEPQKYSDAIKSPVLSAGNQQEETSKEISLRSSQHVDCIQTLSSSIHIKNKEVNFPPESPSEANTFEKLHKSPNIRKSPVFREMQFPVKLLNTWIIRKQYRLAPRMKTKKYNLHPRSNQKQTLLRYPKNVPVK